MKLVIAAILITVLGVITFAQAQKSQKDKDRSPSPVMNHGQEKGHEHGAKGHEHNQEEAHEHGKEEAHEHGKEEAHEHGKEEAHEHGKEEAHEHGHDHEEGERRNVGPDKGVLEASEDLGFKLREGVEERFGIKSQPLDSENPENLPKGSIVYSKEDYQIFRKRDGFWKPITVAATRKGDLVAVESKELKAGDLIAIDGTGFLKIVELSVFGPAIEGHIH